MTSTRPGSHADAASSQRDDTRDIELSLRDPARFGAIFDRHFAEIHGYAAKRAGREVADDIAAETFLTAFWARRRFDPGRGTVKAWLYGIVLAAMPGIQSLGTVKDVSGKQGAAVAYTGRYANCVNGIPLHDAVVDRVLFTSCTVQQVLVIDPATGLPQAEELRYAQLPPGQKWSAPDGLFSYEIFGRSHGTNHNRPSSSE